MRQTSSRKLMCEQDVKIGGQRWLLSAISGNEMAEAILVAFYPQTLIENRIVWLKIAIALIGLMVFVVLWQIVRMFSRRLLVPVESLAAGISCVRSRDFRFRVDYQSEDELGKLVKVFNQTMKDMQDLALGTSVQVSLLPAENYRRGNLSLFARSLFMSKMGGDYYDYFDLPNDRLGIFFGDVAGHGIPAAMIMSMAKAAVSSLEDDYAGPADLLSRTNVVLLHLKQTAQAFEIDCAQGNFRFANAGHCFPYLVAADGASARSLEIIGFPLGSASKKAYEECSGKLEPGMTLVCYSDGIVEAVNSQDEVFGYSRFERLLVDAWSEDLEVYWQNIMAEYNRWAVNQDDDLTFLLARIEGGGE
jgi:serine phosphatase RsbU (regulator of sigma subunit)